jgi:hypothetical protein
MKFVNPCRTYIFAGMPHYGASTLYRIRLISSPIRISIPSTNELWLHDSRCSPNEIDSTPRDRKLAALDWHEFNLITAGDTERLGSDIFIWLKKEPFSILFIQRRERVPLWSEQDKGAFLIMDHTHESRGVKNDECLLRLTIRAIVVRHECIFIGNF